jgi:hypothetical protein
MSRKTISASSRLLGLVTLIQWAHSSEELLTGFHREAPILHHFFTARRFIVANMIINALLTAVWWEFTRRATWARRAARLVNWVMLVNGIGHLMMMMVSRRYFPGGVTGVCHLVANVCLLRFFEGNRRQEHIGY